MIRRLTIAAVLGGALLAARGAVRHVAVAGASMWPTLAPGDRLLLVRRWSRPRPGQLVLVADPAGEARLWCKRVHAVDASGVDVRGDNPAASTDSRVVGRLPPGAVTPYRAWRYAPAHRAGWVS